MESELADITCRVGRFDDGKAFFCLETTSFILSAAILAHEYKKVRARIMMSFESRKEAKNEFVLLADDDILEPLFVSPVDDLFDPILESAKNKEEWFLVLQLVTQSDEPKWKERTRGHAPIVQIYRIIDDNCEKVEEFFDGPVPQTWFITSPGEGS